MFSGLRTQRQAAFRLARAARARWYSSGPRESTTATQSLSYLQCAGIATVAGLAGMALAKRQASDEIEKIRQTAAPTGSTASDSALGSEVKGLKAPDVIPNTDYENEPKPAYYTDTSKPMHKRMESFVLDLQDRLVTALESLEPSHRFLRDRWEREDGKGYGISCVLQDGRVFEKAGVNVSVIEGTLTPGQLKSMRDRNPQTAQKLSADEDYDFCVAGISVVCHPRNPYAPTAHKNYRRFEVYRKGNKEAGPVMAWFGGGADLTPAYLFDEDVKYFHSTLKHACDAHDATYYPRFKAWCDKYFTNTHRGETRGVGGIFFDDLEDKAPEEL
ncbi:Coproporphyrinogen-III oxidase [Dipsacomyces acuminosporus]|nr:Coproporphyrinogen-III oxidase [Dipsacomyces acuminosporus]